MAEEQSQVSTLEQLLAIIPQEGNEPTKLVPLVGTDVQVRIKQISLKKQRLLRRRASDKKGNVDEDMLEALTLQEALVEPKVSLAQAQALREAQFGSVQNLLEEIYAFAGINAWLVASRKAVEEAEASFRQGN
jgi:hypothetical protein